MNFLRINFVIILPALLLFSSCGKKESRFVSEQQHADDLKGLKEFNARKLQSLNQYAVTPTSDLSIDFYFATDDSSKGVLLSQELEQQQFHSNGTHRSAKDKTIWVVSGSSSKVKMDSVSLYDWTSSLCNLGFKHDCQFTGWNPVTE
jgi:hypothetical protein